MDGFRRAAAGRGPSVRPVTRGPRTVCKLPWAVCAQSRLPEGPMVQTIWFPGSSAIPDLPRPTTPILVHLKHLKHRGLPRPSEMGHGRLRIAQDGLQTALGHQITWLPDGPGPSADGPGPCQTGRSYQRAHRTRPSGNLGHLVTQTILDRVQPCEALWTTWAV